MVCTILELPLPETNAYALLSISALPSFYDLPVLSLRNAILNDMLKNNSLVSEYFFVHPDGEVDLRHVSLDAANQGLIVTDIPYRSRGKDTILLVE